MKISIHTDISDIQTERLPVPTKETIARLELVEPGKIPNQRTLILPDPGMTMIDMDLDRADAQFVAWEANDEPLKAILKAGEDLHLQNAKDIWGSHIQKKSPERQLAKVFCHAANYGAYPKKLARALGITVKTAEWIYARWFHLHPGIRDWHNRTRHQLATERLVRNAFGYERYYFDRPENVLNEALAWKPQSSVGIIINTAWYNIDTHLKEVEVLMQVHDSLNMQCPSGLTRELLPKIEEQSLIIVPYDDPLIIPVGFKISDISWGDVEAACCDELQKPAQPLIHYKDDKGIERVKGCKDHQLHSWLATGLKNAQQKALSQLAR